MWIFEIIFYNLHLDETFLPDALSHRHLRLRLYEHISPTGRDRLLGESDMPLSTIDARSKQQTNHLLTLKIYSNPDDQHPMSVGYLCVYLFTVLFVF